MKVAKGRPMTRRCYVCRLERPLREYRHGGGRICTRCRSAEAHRTYQCTCRICSSPFVAGSSKACICSDECRAAARVEWRRGERQRRRESKKRVFKRSYK